MTHRPSDVTPDAVQPAQAPFASLQTPAWRRTAKRALALFGLGVACFLLGATSAWIESRVLTTIILGLGTCLLVTGVCFSVAAMTRGARSGYAGGGMLGVAVVVGPMLAGTAFSLLGAIFTLWATFGFARGRQLRRRGKVLLPPVEVGTGWTRLGLQIDAPAELRAQLAHQWRENGRTEHASVAAFARLTLDLIAIGAPARLIEAANRDSMDEIRHADLCFSIARGLDGRDESPGPFPAAQHAGGLPSSRTLALSQLALSSLIDGALHEGVSARVIAQLVKRCEEPAVRDALRELAADEGRHAAHGWDVVEWCLEEGGAPVAHALRGALRALPKTIDSGLPESARAGAWEKHGIHGQQLEKTEHERACAALKLRVHSSTAKLLRA